MLKGNSKPFTPPELPEGAINLSDPDARVMRTQGTPPRQAFNAQTSVNEQRLVEAGVPVRAIVNPLRGVGADAAYVASAINQIEGPVLAVGHSYGGMIMTNAVPQTTNVVGLVYVAAFAPDEGEILAGIVGRSTDSVLTTAVLESQFSAGQNGDSATELIIDPAKFRDVFTADLPQLESDVYGLSQRLIAAGALVEETKQVAWKDLPSWAAVGTGDEAGGPTS